MILAPGDHLRVPPISMQLRPGCRLRNPLSVSGERTFLPHEVVQFEGLSVTSKLRTTVDLGRRLPRTAAFAAMCSMAKVADFDQEELVFEVRVGGRFAGYRGTEPRGVVGFEVVLGALLAAVDSGVVTSIHGRVEQGHGLLG
jgi:hypothetical protein